MDFRCIFCRGPWYGHKRVFLRVVVWADNADIFIFSLECSHFTLLHDCSPSWQAFAPSACQSVNSVFQTQRCKPLSESLLFARRGCRSRFGDSFRRAVRTSNERGIGGSVVEFSPPTRETRVRFPANASCSCYFFIPDFSLLGFACSTRQVQLCRGSTHKE